VSGSGGGAGGRLKLIYDTINNDSVSINVNGGLGGLEANHDASDGSPFCRTY